MAQQTGESRTTGTYRANDRKDDHSVAKMIIPFAVGLALGWGANAATDNNNNNNNIDPSTNRTNQQQMR